MSLCIKRSLWVFVALLPITAYSQTTLSGQSESANPITVAVPFLTIAPDSRGSALGDAGVASSPDAYSVHWNNAKLAFIDKQMGVSLSYTPWLAKIVDDMSLSYLTFYTKIDKNQALGFSMRYFNLGNVYLTDDTGLDIGTENPRELALDATYSRKLTQHMGIAGTVRYIWSNIAGSVTGSNTKAGKSVAVDVGWYYTKPVMFRGNESELSFGANISNFGKKLTYTTEEYQDFIPCNLRVGSAFKMGLDTYNSLTLMLDFNKLMVPTPPVYETDSDGEYVTDSDGNRIIEKGKDPNRSLLSGTFGSFTDAPGGFKEEMKEINISSGIEYKYQDVLAVRFGYFHESKDKGGREYFTSGIGFKYQVFGVDFSYLIPQNRSNPLANTLRISLVIAFNNTDDSSAN